MAVTVFRGSDDKPATGPAWDRDRKRTPHDSDKCITKQSNVCTCKCCDCYSH